jgi:glycosyltransferase involved in cell wall biosynthesis
MTPLDIPGIARAACAHLAGVYPLRRLVKPELSRPCPGTRMESKHQLHHAYPHARHLPLDLYRAGISRSRSEDPGLNVAARRPLRYRDVVFRSTQASKPGRLRLHVMVLGLRGFPGVQGGVESHAEHLYPLLQQLGCSVEVVVRARYLSATMGDSWCGIEYLRIWAPKSRALEAIVHSLLGVIVAAWRRPDILHIHAVGPALVTPLARLLGLRVVVTHHGPDYNRQKWGALARWALRTGEAWGMRFAQGRIAISRTILVHVRREYRITADLIPNGVATPDIPTTTSALRQFALTPRRYVLMVGRLVPEKRHIDLIEAFTRAGLNGWRLVLVGGADHPDVYSRTLAALAQQREGVISTGMMTGLPLRELFAHAGVFVLPSSYEGLPIALLEALSYGLPVIASDIPANREIDLPAHHYFPLGDVAALADTLQSFARQDWPAEQMSETRTWVVNRFDWHTVAAQSLNIYTRVLHWRTASSIRHRMPGLLPA